VPLGSFASSSWITVVGGTGYNRASVAPQEGRLFAGSNGYVYELDPSSGTVLYSLLLGSIAAVGNYETRIVPSGDSLFAGVHGYAYKVAI
jgi:outer membrane protein assembly factor BamB